MSMAIRQGRTLEVEVDRLLWAQDGVICRRQVLACGGLDHDVRRRLRRREWAGVHPGVYVDHTGPLTWRQRAWAAVLVHPQAALTGASALRAVGLTRHDREVDPIQVVVPARRPVDHVAGVVARRCAAYDEVVLAVKSPPRVTVEHAALTVAGLAGREDAAVAVLADVCQSRLTSAVRLGDHLATLPRQRHKALLGHVLEDVATGAFSALERRYLRHVERPHGLPTATRQRRVRPGRSVAYRDVEYAGLRVVIELDGHLAHGATGQHWADLDRDIDSVVAGDVTVRAGWGQVLEGCRLAAAVARLLRARGWDGAARACGPRCPVSAESSISESSQSPRG